jgi:hypothetical protein
MSRSREMIGHRLTLGFYSAIVAVLVLAMAYQLISASAHSWPPLGTAGARQLVTTCSRCHNQLVAIVFLAVALVVPITANSYSPKLLWVFLRDRTNLLVLAFYPLAAAHAAWVMYTLRDGTVSETVVLSVLGSTVLGFILTIPFFFHVIRYLEPTTFLQRIHDEGARLARRAAETDGSDPQARRDLPQDLYLLGTVILRSVDRLDRESTLEGVAAIRGLLAVHGGLKSRMDDAWFQATTEEFPGLSEEALRFISEDRSWVDIQGLRQLVRALDAALNKMPEALAPLSRALAAIATDAQARGDLPALDNAVRTFNTFLRTALRKRVPHAALEMLLPYRSLAEELAVSQPERAVDIARHLSYYAAEANRSRLAPVAELVGYDLGRLLVHAISVRSAAADPILAIYLEYVADPEKPATVGMAAAVSVTLGRLDQQAFPQQATSLVMGLRRFSAPTLRQALERLRQAREPRFREMTDRQMDLNHLPTERLRAVQSRLREAMPEVFTSDPGAGLGETP